MKKWVGMKKWITNKKIMVRKSELKWINIYVSIYNEIRGKK